MAAKRTLFSPIVRNFSNKTVKVEIKGREVKTATLRLDRPPVNGFNLDVLEEFQDSLGKLERQGVNGVILTSNRDGILTAGIDLRELQTTDRKKMKKYWVTFSDTFVKLYSTPLLTVAAINGTCPAGGCVLSVACDYRVMTKGYLIGANETQIGLIPPVWFIDRLSELIGFRQTELAFNQGKLFSSEEAKDLGLVDEVVENVAQGLSTAQNIIDSYADVPKKAREISKKFVRAPFLEKMNKNADEDIENFVDYTTSETAQKFLQEFLRKLKNK